MKSRFVFFKKWILITLSSFIIIFFSSKSVNANWTSFTPPYVSSDWYLNSILFTSSNEGWAVGQDIANQRGVLLYYLNGTWSSVTPPDVSSYWKLNSVHFTSSNEGWAVGWDMANQRGILLHYSNSNWSSVTTPEVDSYSYWYLNSVHFTSSNEGWAVGCVFVIIYIPPGTHSITKYGGVLLHYLNGTWTSITPPEVSSNWQLHSIHFPSSNEGWAIGGDLTNGRGVLLHYLNGTWSSVNPPEISSDWYLHSIHFNSSNQGWAVGWEYYGANERGVLLHYSNGTWSSITPPDVSSGWYLSSVHFTSSNEGWAVGEDLTNDKVVLLYYSNGTWSSVTPPEVDSYCYLNGVNFISSNEGWAAGGDLTNRRGVLLKYSFPDLTGIWNSLSESCRTIYHTTRCSINGKFNIQNIGDKDVPSIKINFYVSDDALYDGGDTYLFQRTIRNISAGGSNSVFFRTNLPSGMSVKGRYIIAVIDPDNILEESNENNNEVSYGPMP